MNQHTKGPWNIYFASQDNFVIRKMFADGQESHVVARCHSGAADARLIAAAPELLEALKDIAQCMASREFGECCGYSERLLPVKDALGNALAAIKKAEGGV